MVVQWKLPEKFSSFVQRAGRAARGPGRFGAAILLAEPSAFSVDTSFGIEGDGAMEEGNSAAQVVKKNGGRNGKKKTAARGKASTRAKKARLPKEYAELHGRYRGQRGGARDAVPQTLADSVHIQDSTEGMHAFVQTASCRRLIQRAVFANPVSGKSSLASKPCTGSRCSELIQFFSSISTLLRHLLP